MSYEPTTWKKGDKVTSTKLNKIEQGIQGNDSEIGELKSGFSELSARLLNAFPTDIASGSIASFSDGADNLPLKSLVVNINPVQDLHGQESPYPAGGGKNKFNGTFLQGYWAYADGTWVNSPNWITTEKIPCKASTSYTVSADTKMTRWQGFVWYDSNGDFISTDNLNSNANIGLTKTSPSNAAYLIFNIAGYPSSNDTIAPSDVTHFQLEEGSSSTAYAPYSNICPISGYSEAKVYVSPTQDAQDATVYTIDLDGARYGGTLDVLTGKLTVDRAMVDLGAKNWYPSTAAGRTRFRTSITDIERISSPNVRASLLCSNYPTKTANQTYQGTTGVSLQQNSADIYIYDPQTESMTTAEFKSAMSGVQLVYKLATPQTYQLTPTEVKTLLGVNNIFANTGDTEIEYRADPDLYIQRKMPEVPVDDVQINGTSIVTDGVANIPMPKTVNVSGTTPTITAQADTRYVCGEVATLDFTPSQTGICDVVFTSGSTPTVVTLPSTVKFTDGAFTAEADTTYEINILDGIYGAVMAWT